MPLVRNNTFPLASVGADCSKKFRFRSTTLFAASEKNMSDQDSKKDSKKRPAPRGKPLSMGKKKSTKPKPKTRGTSTTTSPAREQEIRNTVAKMKNDPDLTYEMIRHALGGYKRMRDRVALIPAHKTKLLEEKKAAVTKEPDKAAELEKQYARKIDNLDEIVKCWRQTPYAMKPQHQTTLRKIRGTNPTTSYMRYAGTVRSEVVSANPDAKFGEIGKLIGERWRGLTPEEKAKYDPPKNKKPSSGSRKVRKETSRAAPVAAC